MNLSSILRCLIVFIVAWHVSPLSAAESTEANYEPTTHYDDREILGWKIKLNRRLAKDEPALCREVLREIESQLYQITRVVPDEALAKLKKITIWVELFEKNHPCAAYHPDAKWLVEHDLNPDKHRCVELANAHNFVRWSLDQPWMILHELAHGYHHQFLENGFRNAAVRETFEAATSDDRYGPVSHINGAEREHYAATNPMEYFAETSEAFFGTNDFFPYVRAELKTYDPAGYEMAEKCWGGRSSSRPKPKKSAEKTSSQP